MKCFYFTKNHGPDMTYVFPVFFPTIPRTLAWNNFLIFYLLLAFLLPLAILIVLEIVKLMYTRIIEVDSELMMIDYDLKDLRFACMQNSQILEELATINYILSDKTGTMTKNELYFRTFAVKG
mmetsp:Transcript_2344/g.2284  ORF Transcript_2344/g.2284 Transcript_2344/m.2284 type:complete len:123 (+) Transcript_2344:966-1334(+)